MAGLSAIPTLTHWDTGLPCLIYHHLPCRIYLGHHVWLYQLPVKQHKLLMLLLCMLHMLNNGQGP